MAYLYRHIRSDKNVPFYIGIGIDSNYYRAKSKKSRNDHWNKIVNAKFVLFIMMCKKLKFNYNC